MEHCTCPNICTLLASVSPSDKFSAYRCVQAVPSKLLLISSTNGRDGNGKGVNNSASSSVGR